MRSRFTGEHLDEIFKDVEKRSKTYEIESFYSFPQSWGDTSLGFGGMAGQAITSAQTVVMMTFEGEAYIYIGGRYAYVVKRPGARFWEAIQVLRMPGPTEKRSHLEHVENEDYREERG